MSIFKLRPGQPDGEATFRARCRDGTEYVFCESRGFKLFDGFCPICEKNHIGRQVVNSDRISWGFRGRCECRHCSCGASKGLKPYQVDPVIAPGRWGLINSDGDGDPQQIYRLFKGQIYGMDYEVHDDTGFTGIVCATLTTTCKKCEGVVRLPNREWLGFDGNEVHPSETTTLPEDYSASPTHLKMQASMDDFSLDGLYVGDIVGKPMSNEYRKGMHRARLLSSREAYRADPCFND